MIKMLIEKLNKRGKEVSKEIIIEETANNVDREAADALQFMMVMGM